MKTFETVIIAVSAVVIGWFLNELSALFRSRRDDKAAIGRVLYYLAEVRHTMFAITRVMEIFGKLMNSNKEELALGRSLMENFIPKEEELHSQYLQVLDIIADRQPHLAYRLRNKDTIGTYLSKLREFAKTTPEALDAFTIAEKNLTVKFFEHLDEVILELAWIHGVRSWWKFRKTVRSWTNPEEQRKEAEELILSLLQGALPEPIIQALILNTAAEQKQPR